MHVILCSSKIESSEREKIARKHRYSSFEYCEMEPLKIEETFSYKKKRKQADRGIDFYIVFIRDQFTFLAKVNILVKIFSVCKQYVCKTCHLIQKSSIITSVPLLTEFDSITNIQ